MRGFFTKALLRFSERNIQIVFTQFLISFQVLTFIWESFLFQCQSLCYGMRCCCWTSAFLFVQAMWLMLQNDKPDDYVVATGKNYSVREFVELAFKQINMEIV